MADPMNKIDSSPAVEATAGSIITTGVVAIVGRPNVGKSSLFNRLIGKRISIVDPTPGVTRDRIEGICRWRGKQFKLIDTGGIDLNARDGLQRQIQRQLAFALEQAQVLVMVVDVEGLTSLDSDIMEKLRRSDKPLLLVCNKVDTEEVALGVANFYRLGVKKVYPVSALHGRGVGDLLDTVMALLPESPAEENPFVSHKIAILGKPNVGKSSFVNALLKEERVIVDDKAGTTRDAVDIRLLHAGKTLVLTDTAGIRRSKKWESAPEFYSVSRAKSSIHNADAVILMLDAMEGISQQDRKLAQLVQEEGKAMGICLNKWDLVHDVDTREYAEAFFKQIPFARHVPLVYASALQRKNVQRCLDEVLHVLAEGVKSVPTKALNKVIERIQDKQSHPIIKGKRFKIFFASQTGTLPPTFTLFVNEQKLLNKTYLQYVEGKIREAFGFAGVPVKFLFRNRR